MRAQPAAEARRQPVWRRQFRNAPNPHVRFRPGMLGGMEGVGHVPSVYPTLRDQPPRELAIARVAERQHNLIHLTQLPALGVSADAVRKRAAQERLYRMREASPAICGAF
jgi:hypothetical protein